MNERDCLTETYIPLATFSSFQSLSEENNNGKSICKWQNPEIERTNQILQIYPRKTTLSYNNMIYLRGLKDHLPL